MTQLPIVSLLSQHHDDLIASYRYGDKSSARQHHAGLDGDDVHMRLGLLVLFADCGLAASKLPYVDCWKLEELLPTDVDSLARSSCLFLRLGIAMEEDMFAIWYKKY